MRIKHFTPFIAVFLLLSMSKNLEAVLDDIEVKSLSDLKGMVIRVKNLNDGFCVIKREDRREFFHILNRYKRISLIFPRNKEIHKKMAEKVKTIAIMSDFNYKEISNTTDTDFFKIKTNGSIDEIIKIVETLLTEAFSVNEKTKLEFWCWDTVP